MRRSADAGDFGGRDGQADGLASRSVPCWAGRSPNANNTAEFMPIGRALRVNGASFYDVLWKTDNHLYPCRPQGGTWKYDRVGWAPGDLVRPWEVVVSHLLDGDQRLEIEYTLGR